MDTLVILDNNEEEYLLRTWEESLSVRRLQQLFLWAQGLLQGVLPHGIMVCVKFANNGETERVECLRGALGDRRVIDRLCDSSNGLAVRLARHFRAGQQFPVIISADELNHPHPLSMFQAEIEDCQLRNAVVHGTGQLSGGGTFFALFSLPDTPTVRHAFILNMLLPALHLAFLRVLADGASDSESALSQPLTAREIDVLRWVVEGKTNYEIGIILNLSSLTIKNHLQKTYKKLNVSNRMQAATRCRQLHLLDSRNS